MELDKIITLIQAVSESSLTQFTMADGDFKIAMKTDKQTKVIKVIAGPASVEPCQSSQTGIRPQTPAHMEHSPETGKEEILNGNVIKAPLVGTFYHSASPEAEAYVKVGDTVKKGQTLGIVEAMKLMNEIESEFDGVLEKILVQNESVVEYGQPLFLIK